MRRTLPVVAVALSALVLAGCGTQTSGANKPDVLTPEPSVSETSEPTVSTTMGAYNVLAEDVNGFFAAAYEAEQRHPEKAPENREDLLALVDYDFGDGVTLAVYDDSQSRMCFTGPENTYLTLSEPDTDLQRTLGTGECNYDDGEVVLEVVFPDDMPGAGVTERVLKGEDLAKDIPALAEFPDLINASLRNDAADPIEDTAETIEDANRLVKDFKRKSPRNRR